MESPCTVFARPGWPALSWRPSVACTMRTRRPTPWVAASRAPRRTRRAARPTTTPAHPRRAAIRAPARRPTTAARRPRRASSRALPGGISGASGPGETTFEAAPSLPTQGTNVAGNACSASLGADWGTNFAYPADPYAPATDGGPTVKNQSVLGWEGNYYAPFAYLSGSFFARGVTGTYAQSGNSYCGTMFSFGVYGAVRASARDRSVDHGRRLPARADDGVHERQRRRVDHELRGQRHGGRPARSSSSTAASAITNSGTSTVTVDPQPSAGPRVARRRLHTPSPRDRPSITTTSSP